MWTFTWKCRHILWNVDIYSKIWTYIPTCGQLFENMNIYPEIWTQSQKSGQNHTKVDRILENDTFGFSKSGIEYSVASTTIVSIFLASTAHNRARHNQSLIRLVLLLSRRFLVTRDLICRVSSVTCVRHKFLPKYKY